MNRSLLTASYGAVLALGLAACGGGTPNSLPATAPLQAQHGRAQQTLSGCAGGYDSQGYCYTNLGQTTTRATCYDANGNLYWIFPKTTTYHVFSLTADPTDYARTDNPGCGTQLAFTTWDPGDPAAMLNDPNLP